MFKDKLLNRLVLPKTKTKTLIPKTKERKTKTLIPIELHIQLFNKRSFFFLFLNLYFQKKTKSLYSIQSLILLYHCV